MVRSGLGGNGTGQLGDGTMNNRSTPTQVAAGTTWNHAAGGEEHSVAIRSDGTLWAWGRNIYGMLGAGYAMSFETRTLPG